MEEILNQFPHYDGKGQFVGTREYWESIFDSESNRNPELHKAFSELHSKIVNEIIQFCKEHNLEVDEVHITADGLFASRDFGAWTPSTDSSMLMYRIVHKEPHSFVDRDKPFLYEI